MVYNGVTIDILVPDSWAPRWQREERVVTTPIPGASVDDVQWLGLGNQTLTVPVMVATEADLSTLEGSRGITKRSITDFIATGVTITGVMLLKVTDCRSHVGGIWFCTLTFMREA